jgi:signal peptidase I
MTLTTRAADRGRARRAAGPVASVVYLCGRVLSYAITVLITIIAALAVVVAVASHASVRDGHVTAFGHPLLPVRSGSMSPVIKPGDLIIDNPVTSLQAGQLRVGQVASFLVTPHSQAIVTDRIIGRQVVRGVVEYQTKADASPAPDPSLRPSGDVAGVYVTSIPAGAYVLSTVHEPLVFGMLLAVVLLALAVPLYRLARTMDERTADTGTPAERAERGGYLL